MRKVPLITTTYRKSALSFLMFTGFLFAGLLNIQAQLSEVHYLPSLKQVSNGNSFKWDGDPNSTSNKHLTMAFGMRVVEHKMIETKFENNIFQKHKNFKHSAKTK